MTRRFEPRYGPPITPAERAEQIRQENRVRRASARARARSDARHDAPLYETDDETEEGDPR